MADFEFYLGGIEDTLLDILEPGMGGVKTFAYYSGELDTENFKKALGDLTPQFPLIMVSYAAGADRELPAVGKKKNAPMDFEHDCTFVVICASNDARGENARRRGKPTAGKPQMGCYRMIALVRKILSGLWLDAEIGGVKTPLTHSALAPEANEFIARTGNITAYAVPFRTSFRYQTDDHRTAISTAVSEVVVGAASLNAPQVLPNNNPGVKFLVGGK